MSRTMKIWLCLVITALTLLVVSQALPSRRAVAQANPPPDPLPTPGESSCCGMMALGGRTIGGPGLGGDNIFASVKPKEVCVTIKNDHDDIASVAFYAGISVSADGTFGVEGLMFSRHIFIGETATVCSDKVRAVKIGCADDEPLCPGVGWRVDSVQ